MVSFVLQYEHTRRKTMKRDKDRQTDRDRETDRQTETERQTDRQTDRGTYRMLLRQHYCRLDFPQHSLALTAYCMRRYREHV